MRFDVLENHRNFNRVAQMLHKKRAALEKLISRVTLLNYRFRGVDFFSRIIKNKLASVDLTVFCLRKFTKCSPSVKKYPRN